MTRAEAQKLVMLLFAAFPAQTRNVAPAEARASAEVYARGLEDLDRDLAARAVDALVKSARFLPTVAEIRAACVVTQHGRRRGGAEAWGDVIRAIGRYGYMRRPGIDFAFDDPLVARAVDAFGWANLCGSENATADRARFIEHYDQLAENAHADAQLAPGATSPLLPEPRRSLATGGAIPLRAALPTGGDS